MSETILDHGYIAEEHAPDPVVTRHADPTPPGKIALWLFLASEIMFFVGIFASYIILRSGATTLFAEHAAGLNKIAAGINTIILLTSSLTMALAVDASRKGDVTRTIRFLFATILCAVVFTGIKAYEYATKFEHYTLVATKDDASYVYDGHFHEESPASSEVEFIGYRMPAPAGSFRLFDVSEQAVKQASGESKPTTFKIPRAEIGALMNYGPQRNIFYACYFTLTGVHMLHIIGGLVPAVLLLAQSMRGKLFPAQMEYTGLYWNFVDLVWIFLFPLLYLI